MQSRLLCAVMFSLSLFVADQHMNAQSADVILGRLMGNSLYKAAVERIEKDLTTGAYKPDIFNAGLSDLHTDQAGNISAIRKGRQPDRIVVIASANNNPITVAAMTEIARAIQTEDIETKGTLLFAITSGPDSVKAVLENSSYKERIRWYVGLQNSDPVTVYSKPDSIGSTVVQYGLQSIAVFDPHPKYLPDATGILAVPIEMHIPAIAMGVGETKPDFKGVQAALTAVLAMAGV